MKDLLTLNCPNCGGQLEVNSTEMKTNCTFCGTQILIKDFITERRVDKADRIKSLKDMTINAINKQDFTSAYQYCEEICKLDSTKENITLLNVCGVLSGATKFSNSILNELYVFTPDEHRALLANISKMMNSKKQIELDMASLIPNEQQRKVEINLINKTYSGIFRQINSEINKMKKKTCKCGNILEYNEDICPKCGLSYGDYQAELNSERKKKTQKMIILGIIIGVPLIIIVGISAIVYNIYLTNNIHTAINNKNYTVAEQMIDDYQDSNPSRADVYELYAELYLAQDKPQKAIEKLQEGISEVSSSDDKDNLQNKIDQIIKEYKLDKK